MFEHEQLLAQHKEACVMGWRRRSGNLIALRAGGGERGEETDFCSWPRPAPGQAWAGPNAHIADCSVRKTTVFMAVTQDQA